MDGHKVKPKFLVVGAAKCGTTSIFHYLNNHPKIFIPEIKECRFFSQLGRDFKGLGAEKFVNTGITDPDEYFNIFKGKDDFLCGDISNDYLYYYEKSIEMIKKYLDDDIKIIIVLRDPTQRAYSNYMHCVRDGWEEGSFEEGLEKESSRIKNNWAWPYHYIQVGLYYHQVKAYLDNFKFVKIYLMDDLKNKEEFMASLYEFLDIEKVEIEDSSNFNVSGYPKNKLLHKFITNPMIKNTLRPLVRKFVSSETLSKIKGLNLEKLPMSKSTQKKLKQIFAQNNKKLADLIHRDLGHWDN